MREGTFGEVKPGAHTFIKEKVFARILEKY